MQDATSHHWYFGCVHTFGQPYRPERRTALVAREFARHNIDSEARNEICLVNKGLLTEIGGGYTFS